MTGMFEQAIYLTYDYKVKGKYEYHMDVGGEGPMGYRKISATLLVNDDYEGGEFQIKTGRENYIPPQQETGNLLFFPSYLVHRVTLVTKGTRVAIVGWVHGNSFE